MLYAFFAGVRNRRGFNFRDYSRCVQLYGGRNRRVRFLLSSHPNVYKTDVFLYTVGSLKRENRTRLIWRFGSRVWALGCESHKTARVLGISHAKDQTVNLEERPRWMRVAASPCGIVVENRPVPSITWPIK